MTEFVATEKFADDLGPIKATGQGFQYRACLVLDINADTELIEKVEEYYTKLWHQTMDVGGYRGQPTVGEKKLMLRLTAGPGRDSFSAAASPSEACYPKARCLSQFLRSSSCICRNTLFQFFARTDHAVD